MYILFLFIIFSSFLLNLFFILRYVWKKPSGIRAKVQNLIILFSSVFYIILAGETYFYLFDAKSDAFGFTLSSQNWFNKYWTPINSLGYRDDEHTPDDFLNKKAIFVVGDSFASGYGIKNYNDRFSNLIQEKFSNSVSVVNISENGYDTKDEYSAIKSFNLVKPDIIILSYFINDIQSAAYENGFEMPDLISPPDNLFSALVYKSYLVSYIYWNIYRYQYAQEIGQKYWDYLKECYNDNEILQYHYNEIDSIAAYSSTNNINLIVAVFPHLLDIENSKPLIKKITDHLKNKRIEYLDFSRNLTLYSPKDLTVNDLDPHPNEMVHKKVAEALYPRIKQIIEE